MENLIKIGILEDNKLIANLMQQTLERNFKADVFTSNSLKDFEEKRILSKTNLLILDYNLGSFTQPINIIPLLEKINNSKIESPVIVFTGLNDRFRKVQLMHMGVYQVISKDSSNCVEDLVHSVKNSIDWLNFFHSKYI